MGDPLLVLLGAAFLFAGGELLVRSAGRLARAWGMSPLVVGITVVAFGTSSPELAATLSAAIRGFPEVALGTVVGSNISNITLIPPTTAPVGTGSNTRGKSSLSASVTHMSAHSIRSLIGSWA